MVGDAARQALAGLPLISIEKIGDGRAKAVAQGERPLAGIRVLDLSRVIAVLSRAARSPRTAPTCC
jgi:hypothetical protein